MCESNVYLLKSGREELLMEKVDRLIPGEDGTIFLENVFGERRSVKAQIKEMELVRHRIILSEAAENQVQNQTGEWWLEPLTDHGHFHDGEEVKLRLCWGSNMKAQTGKSIVPQVFQYQNGERRAVAADAGEDELLINIGESINGVITVCAQDQQPDFDYYAKMIVEIGHHDHHELHPVGLPLEIMPASYQHPHIGEHYEVTVLYEGKPLAGAKVAATYAGNRQAAYPVNTYTDPQGRARIFLAARGNYLIICQYEKIISSFTLVKSY